MQRFVGKLLNLQVLGNVKQQIRCISSVLEEQKLLLSKHDGGSIDLVKDDSTGIATITLNHAERKNALSGKMMADLYDIVNDLESWKSGRGVLLHGSGGTFCSGADLRLMRALVDVENGGATMNSFMHETTTRLLNLPLVSMAFLEGWTIGGGAELSVSCDLRVMTNKGLIGFVHSSLGLCPVWGGGAKLVQLVGRTRALKLLSSAARLTAADALEIGLIDKVVSSKSEAIEYLCTFTRSSASSEALHAAKSVVVNGTSELNFDEKLDSENDIFKTVFGAPAHVNSLNRNVKFSKKSN